MNYKVLYRKYRPQIFDEVVGQDNIITILKESITLNKISHAYIFSGPRGTGKTSTAKIFAKALNCLDRKDYNPCGKCESCNNFNYSNDIYEIDAASNNGVDQIRDIIENVKLTPINSKYKIYIIDEVHMLSTSAFNALLLTLEEPPSHAIFILATTDIENVPITVLSRCQRLDFRKISCDDIINNLDKICKKEKINIEHKALEEIANFSEGGMRDALSILDQLSKENDCITYEKVINIMGLVPNSEINNIIKAINDNDANTIINFINKIKITAPDYKTLVKRFIDILKNRAIDNKLNKINDRLTYDDYKRMCFELSDTLYKTNVNVNLFDLFELILLDYINSNQNKKVEIIPIIESSDINKVNDGENLISDDYLLNMERIRINNCFVKATKSKKIENSQNWLDFVKTVDTKKIKGLIEDTNVVLSSDDIIVISTLINSMVSKINSNIESIEKKYNKIYNGHYKIIATSIDNWNIEIEKYKNNIKNNVIYKLIDEPNIIKEIDDVVDIFDKNKIVEK